VTIRNHQMIYSILHCEYVLISVFPYSG